MLDRPDVPLAPLTTLRLGGPAARLVTAFDEADLLDVVRTAGEPLLLLGGGSNLVLPDAGVAGTVVHVATHGLSVRRDGDRVLLTAAAGEDWDALVGLTVAEGLAGLEALSGIPGLVGACPVQNIGAYGAEVAQTVTAVRALDRNSGAVVELGKDDCGFGYRDSRFKREAGRWVVLDVTFALRPAAASEPVAYTELARALDVELGQRAAPERVRPAVLALRRGKGMVLDEADPDSRSVGSFFTNPLLSAAEAAVFRARARQVTGEAAPEWADGERIKTSAAWLIERAGFAKGSFDGPVGLSTKHTLALVHRGGGTTADLLRVARAVRDGVQERFGVALVPEPTLLGTTL